MIKREKYLDRIIPFIDKPVIKAITGIRRCGKSTFLKMLMQDFFQKGIKKENVLYINMDSLDFDFLQTYKDLNSYVKKQFRQVKGNKYLIIDEVQEIEEWERAVSSIYADNIADIYITGSNAGLLSSELASLLTGRYIEFKMNTLVFSEFLNFRGKTIKEKEEEFSIFLKFGGFPGIHSMEFSEEVLEQYISAIYSTILLKDVVARNQVRDVALLERITRYLADNCGNITTAKSISNYIKSQKLNCSVDTVQNYLQWLSDAYLALKVNRYDIKGKRQLELYEKYFMGDIGLIFSIIGDKVQDISGKLENIVFLELVSRGYNVNIGKVYNKEVDFVATKKNKRIYIQVAYLLSDEIVIEREFNAFSSIKDNYTKIVLSLDKYFGSEKDGIKWFNLIDFLLMTDY